VDINPNENGVAIGNGGSFFVKMAIDEGSKTLSLVENYSLTFSNYYDGNICFDESGEFFI
jgi:hypothetical protein